MLLYAPFLFNFIIIQLMEKESALQLAAGDYAISHYEQDKVYSALEVHKMLADAFIAGHNSNIEA